MSWSIARVNMFMRFEQGDRCYALAVDSRDLDVLSLVYTRLDFDQADLVLRWLSAEDRERAIRWLLEESGIQPPSWDAGIGTDPLGDALWRGQLVVWDMSPPRPSVSGGRGDQRHRWCEA